MNFRTALGVAVTIVMTSASLLIPATAGAQETTTTEASTEASAVQTATETPEKSTEATTAASTPDAQDPNPDSKSDPNRIYLTTYRIIRIRTRMVRLLLTTIRGPLNRWVQSQLIRLNSSAQSSRF